MGEPGPSISSPLSNIQSLPGAAPIFPQDWRKRRNEKKREWKRKDKRIQGKTRSLSQYKMVCFPILWSFRSKRLINNKHVKGRSCLKLAINKMFSESTNHSSGLLSKWRKGKSTAIEWKTLVAEKTQWISIYPLFRTYSLACRISHTFQPLLIRQGFS